MNIPLVLAAVLAPMTGLRVADKIGPAEVLVVLWCAVVMVGSKSIHKALLPHLTYWLVFLIAATMGALFASKQNLPYANPAGLVTWYFLGVVSLVMVAGLQSQPVSMLEATLSNIARLGTILYTLLYIYSRLVSSSLAGVDLWFGGDDPALGARFTGGGTNPHQLALFLTATLFVHIRDAIKASHLRTRLVALCLIAACVFLGSATASSSMVTSVVATILIAGGLGIVVLVHRPELKVLTVVALTALFIVMFPLLRDTSLAFIAADPNGMERIDLWESAPDTFAVSPLVGLGPGAFAMGGGIEFHNNYLEVLAMGGLLGLTSFAVYSLWILGRLLRYPSLLAIVLPLFTYGLSGFSARRLPYWIFLMLVVALAEGLRDDTEASRGSLDGSRLRWPAILLGSRSSATQRWNARRRVEKKTTASSRTLRHEA